MKLQPMHDWAVIRPVEAKEMTAGGLYIPETAKEKPQEGIVEAIGPGAYEEEKYGRKKEKKKERRFVPTVVKPGDRVLYGKYAGQTYTIGTEELILVRERDILGLLPALEQKPLQIPATTSAAGPTALETETKVKTAEGKSQEAGAKKAPVKKAAKKK